MEQRRDQKEEQREEKDDEELRSKGGFSFLSVEGQEIKEDRFDNRSPIFKQNKGIDE
jgi:hypothetical protein